MFEGFSDRVRTVLLHPSEGFRMVNRKPSIVEGILLVLVTIGLTLFYYYLLNAATANREFIVYFENMSVFETATIPDDFSSLATYVLIRGTILWIGGALIVNIIAQTLGGRSSILKMLVIAGYCTLPIIILTVIACVPMSLLEPYDATLYYFMGNNTTSIAFGAGYSPYYLIGRAILLTSGIIPVFYWYFGVRESQEFLPRRPTSVKDGPDGEFIIPENFARNRAILTIAIAFAIYVALASEFSPYAMI